MFGMSEGIITLAAIGVPVLGIAGGYCLLFCKGEEYYKHLVRTAVVFLDRKSVV